MTDAEAAHTSPLRPSPASTTTPPAPATSAPESDDFGHAVLRELGTDPRTAELVPTIWAMTQSLAPAFGVSAADASPDAGASSGIGDVFAAVHDAVVTVRTAAVRDWHGGTSWRDGDSAPNE